MLSLRAQPGCAKMVKAKAPKIAPDNKKFRELILFIAQRSEGDLPFGATKLNKLLFYSDFLAYLSFGQPITGHRYQKLPNGPAPRALLPILKGMEASDEVRRVERQYYGKTQERVLALREADLDVFSSKEIDLITQIIKECWGKSGSQMSAISHRFRGWMLAKDSEDIPYEVALVQFQQPNKADAKHWRKVAPDLKRIAKECLADDSP